MGPASDKQSQRTLLRLFALLGYPILIGLALWLEQPGLRAFGLPLLALAAVGPWPAHWPGRMLLIGSLLLALVVVGLPALALWPPGLICLATAAWFGQSLRPGQQALIGRFANLVQQIEGRPLPADSAGWLRGWTWFWTVLLSLLGAAALALAATDQAALWLAWVSLVIPISVLSTLVLEYLLRRLRFPGEEHIGLGRFLVMLARIRPEQLAR